MISSARSWILTAVVAGVLLPGPARAQFSLGQQRAGTSSATFLKIGIGARAVGLGESFVAVANDPTAMFWNPAGIASMQRQGITLSHASWPGDVNYEHIAYVLPVRRHVSDVLVVNVAGPRGVAERDPLPP